MNEECFRREGQTIALQWYKSCVWVHPLEKYTCECIDLEYTIAKLYVICEAFLFIYLSCNVIFSPSFLHSFCLIDRVVEDCKHSDWGFFCVVGWNGEFLSDVLRSLHPQFTCEECIFFTLSTLHFEEISKWWMRPESENTLTLHTTRKCAAYGCSAFTKRIAPAIWRFIRWK